jgi:hypothetical protein
MKIKLLSNESYIDEGQLSGMNSNCRFTSLNCGNPAAATATRWGGRLFAGDGEHR